MKYSSWFFMFLIVLMGNPELYEELKEGKEIFEQSKRGVNHV